MYLLARIFELHNKDKFKIFAYSYGSNDEMRQRLIKSVSCFEDVRLKTDHDIALLARNDKIDIAVDLKGYTKGGRTGIFCSSCCSYTNQLPRISRHIRNRFYRLYYCRSYSDS